MNNDEKIIEMLAALTGTVNNLTKDMQEVKQRLDSLEKGQKYVRDGVDFLSEELFGKNNLIDYIDGKFKAVDARFDDMQAEFDVLNERQHATDVRVAKLRRVK